MFMCMELMDLGSLETIRRQLPRGIFPEAIIGKMTVQLVTGLAYLYDTFKVVHRDIKPSNILINSSGSVKLCDFGVSGQLMDSIARTYVGTNSYMAPERVLGDPYTVRSDVWSLGLTLVEFATGRHPYRLEDGT